MFSLKPLLVMLVSILLASSDISLLAETSKASKEQPNKLLLVDDSNSETQEENEEEKPDTIKFSGYVRNYVGLLTGGNQEYAIIQNTLDLRIEKRTDQIAFKANPVVYHYTDDRMDFLLREAYVQLFFSSMEFKIGKQQIIWGKADGVFITDVISPKDFREFLLPDFHEIRIGVTAVKANFFIGKHNFEFIWLPVFTETQIPNVGSRWKPTTLFPLTPTIHLDNNTVNDSLKNSDAFAKYSVMTSFIDLELMAGYTIDDEPTMHTFKTINPTTKQLVALDVYPEYHRLALGGGSFSSTLGPLVIRGEGAYYTGKYFNSSDPLVKDAVVKKDYANYMIGFDFTILGVKNSTQFIQKTILNYDTFIIENQYQNLTTYLIMKDFINETLNISLFIYYDIDNESYLIRPKIVYKFADGFDLLIGANIFGGTKGNFGQYDANDMVYTKITYHF